MVRRRSAAFLHSLTLISSTLSIILLPNPKSVYHRLSLIKCRFTLLGRPSLAPPLIVLLLALELDLELLALYSMAWLQGKLRESHQFVVRAAEEVRGKRLRWK